MTITLDEFLAAPLSVPVGQPLRVAVYSRMAHGIRSHVFGLGSALPRESELGERLNVSRTVVREALMLLEEDGLIRTRRGVGRFVVPALPRPGLEQLHPFESILSAPGHPIQVERLEMTLQRPTDFVMQGLGLDEDSNAWFCESRLSLDGEPVALVQEHIPAGIYLRAISQVAADRIQELQVGSHTLLSGLADMLGPVFGPGQCRITAGIAGVTRAKLLNLQPCDPLLVLTQTAGLSGKAAYLAKYVVVPGIEQLSIQQAPQPAATITGP